MTLNAPYAATELLLDREFFEMLKGKKVFCGMKNTLLKAGDYFKELTLLDYSKREEFAVRNAVPTAEGALEIAMGEYDGMIAGSRCLVTGFGRIGKVLSGMLKGMGARVTVSARKPEDLAWIEIYGYTPCLLYTSRTRIPFLSGIPSWIYACAGCRPPTAILRCLISRCCLPAEKGN